MRIPPAAVISLVGGIYSLYFASKLGKLKVTSRPPRSRGHLSLEERQRKMKIGSWLAVAGGVVLIAGAGMILWLSNAN